MEVVLKLFGQVSPKVDANTQQSVLIGSFSNSTHSIVQLSNTHTDNGKAPQVLIVAFHMTLQRHVLM